MLAAGKAYHCYASPQELEEMRDEQRRAGVPMRYRRPLARSRSEGRAAGRGAGRSG